MPNDFKKINALLSSADKQRLLWLLLPMSLAALMNIGGIALIMPFMGVVANPSSIQTNHTLAMLYHFFGFTHASSFIFSLGVASFILLVITNSLAAFTVWVSNKVVVGVRSRIAQTLYEAYLDKPYEYHLSHNSSTLVNNIFITCENFTFGYLLMGAVIVTNVISILAIMILIFWMNPLVSLLVIFLLGGLYGLMLFAVRNMLDRGGQLVVTNSEAAVKLVNEAFGGIKDIKLKAREAFFKRQLLPKLLPINNFQAIRQMMVSIPRYLLEMMLFSGVILFILAMLTAGKNLAAIIPTLSLYIYSGYRLMPAAQALFGAISSIKTSRPSLHKIYDSFVKDTDLSSHEVKAEPSSTQEMIFKDVFEIQGLAYHYPGHEQRVLDGIDMTIQHNDIVGIIGSTGAGKTTLIDIILGLLQPTSGIMKVDGACLDSGEKIKGWQRAIGYVPQHIYLSDSTIEENIAFGEDSAGISQLDIERAAKTAAIHDFIVNVLPDGYQTMVGERGIKLSGGQIQRIGIARALYRNPSVLVLDEATSSLDGQTEADVMRAIYNMRDKITIIIVAHRLSTVARCDQVFLMEKGAIVDTGRLDDLVARHRYLQKDIEILG